MARRERDTSECHLTASSHSDLSEISSFQSFLMFSFWFSRKIMSLPINNIASYLIFLSYSIGQHFSNSVK